MSGGRCFILPVTWMGVIFVLSTSLFGSSSTGAIFVPVFRFFYPGAPVELVDLAHTFFRKGCHLTEYAVLASFWYHALTRGSCMRVKKALLTAFLLSALYAMTDEYHQSFVSNRTASVMDVLVDACGAAAMLMVQNHINKKTQGSPCAKDNERTTS